MTYMVNIESHLVSYKVIFGFKNYYCFLQHVIRNEVTGTWRNSYKIKLILACPWIDYTFSNGLHNFFHTNIKLREKLAQVELVFSCHAKLCEIKFIKM